MLQLAHPSLHPRIPTEGPFGPEVFSHVSRNISGDAGVQECGFSQNCLPTYPKQIPLAEAISDVTRDVTLQVAKDFLCG